MIRLRKALDRGHADHGWLNTYHTFSFADYQDPAHMGFRALRVINEDRVAPGMGFGTHGHRDMEIISYVLEGALEHKDSLGNGSVLHPGEFQRISAGTGVRHSEFNPSATEPVHFYQIWLLPERVGIQPSYEQKLFTDDEKRGRLRLVASPERRPGLAGDPSRCASLPGDARCSRKSVVHPASGRHLWLQVLRGKVAAGGQSAQAGDGLSVSDEPQLSIAAAGTGRSHAVRLA